MKTVDRAIGHWREILPQLGIDPRFLVNRHGPCPICGGKDRFRFDDRDGSGSYICGQCGAGNGVILLRKKHGWDYATACAEIDKVIGKCGPAAKADHGQGSRADRLAKVQKIITEATKPKIVADYLASRRLSTVPPVLLGHPTLPYVQDGQYRGRFPAVIAPIIGPDGALQSAHRIYLADLPERKKAMPPVDTINGAAVRLFEAGEILGVSEGVETGIAAHELFQIPTWAAITATGMEKFQPPAGVKTLVIFGDNDSNFAGQKAAFVLANRLVRDMAVEVHIPPASDSDWLDVRAGR